MNTTPQPRPGNAPELFYMPDNFGFPIAYKYLCAYPIIPEAYAVYINDRTKLPERVFISAIHPDWLSITKVLSSQIESMERRLDDLKKERTGKVLQ